ncbi:MAG: BON domain-containing protein [Pseudomonadaceae bacterium]|nr:BON domain-containing protein [Pseudomonadaceae bacterium]
MKLRTAFALALLATTAVAVGACTLPMAVGAGAAAGYVGLQSRPTKQVAEDTRIKVAIKDKMIAMKFNYISDIGVDVFYNDVLLTGIVPTREEGEKVLEAARRIEGVNKVYNELFVGAEYSTAQKAKDAWISTQIQPRLIGDRETYPLNYLINVVNGHVYVIGSAQSPEEYQHVLHILRTVNGVKQVHDYIVLKDITSENIGDTATGGQGWLSKISREGNAPDPLADGKLK